MPIKGEYVYRRKDGLWEARYVKEITASGKKKYGSVYAHTCKEAKQKRKYYVENVLLRNKENCFEKITVSKLVTEWLELNKCRLKPSTYQRYSGFYNKHIKDRIGNFYVETITTSDIQVFAIEKLNSGLKARTVNSILVFLHTCFKYGNSQYKYALPLIIYLPEEKKEMRVFSREEQKELVNYLLNDIDIYKFGVLLTLYTGLRVGELCALKWEDIENDCIKIKKTMLRIQDESHKGTKVIVVDPKTSTSARTIPIPTFLIDMVNSFGSGRDKDSYVLGTSALPTVEPRIMQYKLRKYLKDLRILDATFHTLRHTFATRSVEFGFDIKSLSEIMGHSGVSTTLDLYVHSTLEQKRSNMDRLQLMP